ncbi:CocE/NonD family hydrolase [Frondihabitans australicus]|uniref:Xaa-Pro dipeptidyl-peptidase C-terminal domain-containing protein n=1 Tax=Frondihabitans australicus TaxID=386892 RepID=A0A495ILC6_9MICO|nr:CocE/NonD family hydrolase [Frondihabitans australicus]RKR75935.1 hypothetical protein C8E83_3099 [Frondihabitans australicus]
MSDDLKTYLPSTPLPPERTGVLTPFEPSVRTLPAGFRIAPQFRELPVDIVFEKDVPVTLRDGVVVHVDVFRPLGDEPVPVIMAYSPYGKGQGTSASAMGVFGMVGLSNDSVSGLLKFEGPDPAFWCAHGYAICNPDIRGVVDSDGDSVLWDRQDGRDGYDLVEWLAEQEWCTGRVAMSGTSYLAATQWFTAAERPPHLAAINPWEGVSDTYRDLVMRGGMPDTGFARQLRDNSFFGRGRKEDILAEADAHPLVDDLWAEKVADLGQIDVPAYVVASYSNTLHTAGTFRGWRRIASSRKWLRIHNSQEWPDYYDETNRADLLRFFDHVLRDVDNGWEATPRVRYSVLDLEGGDETGVAAGEFPPEGSVATRYYLDAGSRILHPDAPTEAATAGYTVGANPEALSFVTRFDTDTTLVGYPSAHLFVEAEGSDDMDLFVLIQKLDRWGTPLQAFTVPNQSAAVHDVTEHGASILRYKGSDGRIRVSLRHLDPALSTDDVPAHTFDRVEKLTPGEVVEVDIDLLPLGLRFAAGEQLRFVVSSRNLLGTLMPGIREYAGANSGRHVVHTGGTRASYLRLPVLRAQEQAHAAPGKPSATVRLDGHTDDASILGHELFSARRTLALLKGRLGRERILDLLAPEIRASDEAMRTAVDASEGRELSGSTTLLARGITAGQFGGWLAASFDREDAMLAAHPEHYVIHTEADGRPNIVETLGEQVCSFFMDGWDAAEEAEPGSHRSRLVLADGTVIGWVSTLFTDVPGGFTAKLSVGLPAACGQATVDQHLGHFSVEFRNWILGAAGEVGAA